MKNEQVAAILENIATLLEIQEVKFKPRAYAQAARAIEVLGDDIVLVAQRGELEQIPGVGSHIAAKIQEIVDTGKLKYYEELKKKVKVDVESLRSIPFLGPKKIKKLYKELRVKNIKDLKKAIDRGKVRELDGFGEKTEKSFLEGIELLGTRPKRFPIKDIKPIARKMLTTLSKNKYVTKIEIAGSFRREKKTVKDLDILLVGKNVDNVMSLFVSLGDKVLARGPTKAAIRLKSGLQVDLRVVGKDQWGAALLYFTGSKDFNIYLRKLALKKSWTLNEYALTEIATKDIISSRTERGILKKLGLKWIKPKDREDRKKWG